MQEREFYREYVQKHHLGTPDSKWLMISGTDLMKMPREPIGQGFRWGHWQLDATLLTLTHIEEGYEIDLEKLTTPARVCDVIFQVAAKLWCTKDDAGDLLEALHMLLDPQKNLCSCGRSTTCNAAAVVRARIEPCPPVES